MKHLLLGVALVGILGLMVVGCGERAAPTKPGKPAAPAPVMAMSFDDGAEPYFPMQFVDPVSGEKPIKQEFFVDVDGKRVYFNSAESRDEFKKDPSKYLQALQQVAR